MFVYLDKIFRNIFCDKRLKTCFTPYFPDEPKTTGNREGFKEKKSQRFNGCSWSNKASNSEKNKNLKNKIHLNKNNNLQYNIINKYTFIIRLTD